MTLCSSVAKENYNDKEVILANGKCMNVNMENFSLWQARKYKETEYFRIDRSLSFSLFFG